MITINNTIKLNNMAKNKKVCKKLRPYWSAEWKMVNQGQEMTTNGLSIINIIYDAIINNTSVNYIRPVKWLFD